MMNNTALNFTEILQESSTQCREFFNDRWKLYQKVLGNNYMGHREIYHVLHEFLISNWQQPFKLLDLGCGDASFIAQSLVNTSVSSYCGLDISQIAIAIARKNMRLVSCEQEFIQGDFCQVIPSLVKEEKTKFNIILSSFAFHHLNLEQKDYIFSQLKQLLLPGGVFILIDLVSQEGESRESYIPRYLKSVEKNWLQITSEEMSLVSHHMLESDYPESQKTLELLAKHNGFQKVECLYQQEDTTQLCCFYT
ncbi:Methyltransferase type 12 [Hyella patelloides LEGE 07179]|uniref:Methyltransferase type 12 n=1 Tax=Hyella patelloides LEGE 07179 TaxID=945734 RepID=A0A563VLP6_9CYAN|nr:class I SAM-dependent methyltransferase [Hyella patelloides]VEP12341.1 Methyltransferase type 12 [Hyella patelloides LEGE 07179]